MPETRDYRGFYSHTMRYPPKTPYRLLELAWTREQEDPYRKGKAVAIRPPFSRSVLFVGRWGPPGEPVLEDEHSNHLLEALDGWELNLTAGEIAKWGWTLTTTNSLWSRVKVWWASYLDRKYERQHEDDASFIEPSVYPRNLQNVDDPKEWFDQ